MDNPTLRYDSEYYKKEYFRLLIKFDEFKTEKMGTLVPWITQGPNPSFSEQGMIPCLTGRNISKGRVVYEGADYVDESEYQLLKRYQISVGDTLITLKGQGSIGKIGYVISDKKTIFSRDIGILRPENINTAYLNAFVLSKYGQALILRGETGGTGQRTLTTTYLKYIPVPIFKIIENSVGNLVVNSEKVLEQSKKLYMKAERLLLEELDLLNHVENTEAVSVKTFSESFGASGRLDAEYYQLKYDEMNEKITQFNHDTLGQLVHIKKSIEPGSECYGDEGVPFVRVSNLSKYEISEPNIKIPFGIVPDIQALYPKKDTILLSKDGSVGIAYKVPKDMCFVTSGAILNLKINDEKKIIPDYLTLILNSIIVQLQAEKDAGGSVIQHWKPSEIEKVVIPILDIEIQRQISEEVQLSFVLRKKSTDLLEYAKYAVEMAIEEGEDAAMRWLEEVVQ